MPWHSSFHIAHINIEIRADSDICRDEMQSIISLYEPTENITPDIVFRFEEQNHAFTLSANREPLWQSGDSRDFPPAFEIHLYFQVIERMTPQILPLHASAVSVDNSQVCLFAGASGAGKSSICTAAILDGAAYLTDEFALLDESGLIHPFPRPLQWDAVEHPAFSQHELLNKALFSKSQYSFPDPDGNIVTSQLWLPASVQHQPGQATCIILPQYDAAAPASELLPLRRGEALMQLPQHLHQKLSPAESLKELNHRISNDARFFSLRFSDVRTAWRAVRQQLVPVSD